MNNTRRDLLTAAIGGAAGLAFTPVPWKVLDDVSIWTQNWSWLPVPPRAEITIRHTACTLCPRACPVRVRCAGDHPVGLAAVSGGLCAIGAGAHQLPYHPARLADGSAPKREQVQREIDGARGRLAVLDMQPGRAASAVWQRFAASKLGAIYVAPDPPDSASVRVAAQLAGIEPDELGIDWSKVNTLVSFGTRLLERPGPALAAWSEGRLRVVHFGTETTPTAALADQWMRQVEGEIPAVDGVAVALSAGGLSPDTERRIAEFNAKSGAMVRRGKPVIPMGERLLPEMVEDGSIDVLLADQGLLGEWPKGFERKLARSARVVSFSPFCSRHAKYAIATPAYLEATADALASWDAVRGAYTVAPAVLKAVKPGVDPAGFLGIGDTEAEMKARAAAIFGARRGSVAGLDGKDPADVSSFETAEKLWERMKQGAVWTDAPGPNTAVALNREPSIVSKARLKTSGIVPPLATRVLA